jgi:hypothetical protein
MHLLISTQQRANTDSHNSHNTQHARVKQNALCFIQKDIQPSQKSSGGHITPNKINAGDDSLLMGSIIYTIQDYIGASSPARKRKPTKGAENLEAISNTYAAMARTVRYEEEARIPLFIYPSKIKSIH